jgi:hypothetical protein
MELDEVAETQRECRALSHHALASTSGKYFSPCHASLLTTVSFLRVIHVHSPRSHQQAPLPPRDDHMSRFPFRECRPR